MYNIDEMTIRIKIIKTTIQALKSIKEEDKELREEELDFRIRQLELEREGIEKILRAIDYENSEVREHATSI